MLFICPWNFTERKKNFWRNYELKLICENWTLFPLAARHSFYLEMKIIFFCFKIILKDRCLKLEINIQIGSIFKIIVAWSLKNNFLICTKVIIVLFRIISYISFPFVNLMYDSSTLAMNLAFPSSPTTETMSLPSCGGHLT